ncbi:glutamate receptor 2.5-like [Nymphaea colorata]|nr:glutamate receptor 2.5-like [Nymphaea colorata]
MGLPASEPRHHEFFLERTTLGFQPRRRRTEMQLLVGFLLVLISSSLPHLCSSSAVNPSATDVKVGLILDSEKLGGRNIGLCVDMAMEDFYSNSSSHSKRLVLQRRPYNSDMVGAVSAATDLLENVEVEAILGPRSSGEAEFVAKLGDRARVPVISFTATSPSLSLDKDGYFLRAAQSDANQVDAIADIVKAYGWGEVVLVYEGSEFGRGMIPYLTDALQQMNVKVPSRSILANSQSEDQIKEELYRLKGMQTRVFVVHMGWAPLGRRLFKLVRELEMLTDGYVWIVTNGIGNQLVSLNPSEIASMEGVLGLTTFVPKSEKLDDFKVRWRQRIWSKSNLTHVEEPPWDPDIFCLWAYDTVWALASAVERTEAGNIKHHQRGNGRSNSTGVFGNLGVSSTGPSILHEMRRNPLQGLSGDFDLRNGQLTTEDFEILNLIGRGEKRVGFWKKATGLSRTGKVDGGQKDSSLKTVNWPGGTTATPRGWEIPTSGKKLIIGVPVKLAFTEFLKIQRNPTDGSTAVEGYCIDVFNMVLQNMPYYLPHKFVPFEDAEGKPNGTYNELVYQVFLGNFDAVVGDTTIRASRTKYVDFTLPYTETGVSMIVRMKAGRKSNPFIFLKPMTAQLWVVSGVFFVWTGLVVWILEHRINDEFRGPPLKQFGLVYYFAFSTMVFAHREKLQSNLSRVVVIVWVFVVLILTQSYTASLTSMLTVQQLQPTVTDIQTLLRNGESIGYQNGSFVRDMLIDQLNVPKNKLKAYNSPEEYADALTNGSKNGGVGAIFDEIPLIKLFLAKYCDGFAMVGPVYRAEGFGFVFPKGSPLVSDVSRAILNVTEGDKMMEINKALFGNQTCVNAGRKVESDRLSVTRLWGLFLLTGTTSLMALLVFFLRFFYNYLKTVKVEDTFTGPTTWLQRVKAVRMNTMLKHFDQKDMSSHTFRNTREGGSRRDMRIHPLSIPNSGEEPPHDIVIASA